MHDVRLAFPPSGITMHCSYASAREAAERLEAHCTLRKYDTRAESWHGLWLDPRDGLPRFGVKVEYPWEADPQMRSEEHTSELQVTNAHLVCRLLLEKKNITYNRA